MVQEVVGSNPSTGYWVDIFSHCIVVKNCNVCLKRSKLNDKQAGEGLFKKNNYSNNSSNSSSNNNSSNCFLQQKNEVNDISSGNNNSSTIINNNSSNKTETDFFSIKRK